MDLGCYIALALISLCYVALIGYAIRVRRRSNDWEKALDSADEL